MSSHVETSFWGPNKRKSGPTFSSSSNESTWVSTILCWFQNGAFFTFAYLAPIKSLSQFFGTYIFPLKEYRYSDGHHRNTQAMYISTITEQFAVFITEENLYGALQMPQGCWVQAHGILKHKNYSILLRDIQLTHVQCYWGSTVKMVFSYKIFCTCHEANMCGAPERLTAFDARTFL
jgi:hypothetical protein